MFLTNGNNFSKQTFTGKMLNTQISLPLMAFSERKRQPLTRNDLSKDHTLLHRPHHILREEKLKVSASSYTVVRDCDENIILKSMSARATVSAESDPKTRQIFYGYPQNYQPVTRQSKTSGKYRKSNDNSEQNKLDRKVDISKVIRGSSLWTYRRRWSNLVSQREYV